MRSLGISSTCSIHLWEKEQFQVLTLLTIFFSTMSAKMQGIRKHPSTYFKFLSEVQHISTCSNNACPYSDRETKNNFIKQYYQVISYIILDQ